MAPDAKAAQIEIAAMSQSLVQQKEPIDTYRNMIQGVQNDWADLIYTTLRDGKINFRDFFDSVLQGFLRMVAQMAAADLANAIFGGQGLGGLTGGNIAGMINGATGGGGGGIAGAIGSTVSSIFGGGGAAMPGGVAGVANGGAAAAGGGSVFGTIGAGISTAASTIWGGVTGTASAIGGGMSAAGSAVMGALQAIPGWGWALAGLGLAAAALDSGGTYSHNAGFLLRPLSRLIPWESHCL